MFDNWFQTYFFHICRLDSILLETIILVDITIVMLAKHVKDVTKNTFAK